MVWTAVTFRLLGEHIGKVVPSISLWLEHIDSRDRADVAALVRGAFGGRSFVHRHRIIRRDRTSLSVTLAVEAVKGDAGRVTSLTGIYLDTHAVDGAPAIVPATTVPATTPPAKRERQRASRGGQQFLSEELGIDSEQAARMLSRWAQLAGTDLASAARHAAAIDHLLAPRM